MGTLIKNGTLVTAADTYKADLRIDETGAICAIGKDLQNPSDYIVDAQGLYVIPGGIDAHTHFDLPVMNTASSDDFYTGTVAAAFGGTTTIIDYPVPDKGRPLSEAFEKWQTKAAKKVTVDYGFHMCVNDFSTRTLGEMTELMAAGITSFKLFTAYPATLMVDDGAIFRMLHWAQQHGALIQVHAENGPAILALSEMLIAAGQTEPRYHALSRPPRFESEATARVLALAAEANASVYIVHLTCQEALAQVHQARIKGTRVFAETCPQYLFLSALDLSRPNFEGAKFVCSPPLREKQHAQALWQGLTNNEIQVVASDHCPFNFRGQKEQGCNDFRRIPNGLPGVEPRMMLLYQGVRDGKISLNQFVDLTATAPAKILGLYPRKGSLAIGSDADIVLWNPQKQQELSAHKLHMRVDYSPYETTKVVGGPEKVFLRGQLIVDDEKFLGQAGQGQFIKRAGNN